MPYFLLSTLCCPFPFSVSGSPAHSSSGGEMVFGGGKICTNQKGAGFATGDVPQQLRLDVSAAREHSISATKCFHRPWLPLPPLGYPATSSPVDGLGTSVESAQVRTAADGTWTTCRIRSTHGMGFPTRVGSVSAILPFLLGIPAASLSACWNPSAILRGIPNSHVSSVIETHSLSLTWTLTASGRL